MQALELKTKAELLRALREVIDINARLRSRVSELEGQVRMANMHMQLLSSREITIGATDSVAGGH